MIRLESVSKSFGKLRAVDHVNLTAGPGKITGFLGPNGAGKSTTMRMISGAMRPDAGDIWIDDIPMAVDPIGAKRRLGILGDARGLYGRLTTRENIAYYGRLRGMRAEEITQSLDHLIQVLAMGDIIDKRTAGFSTGQAVKVALGRALLHRPRNIILDEPTSGLDVLATKAMRDFIRSLKQEGCSVIFTSHIIQEVAEVCDEIVLIHRGRVIAEGDQQSYLAASGADNLEAAILRILAKAEMPT